MKLLLRGFNKVCFNNKSKQKNRIFTFKIQDITTSYDRFIDTLKKNRCRPKSLNFITRIL